MNPNYGTLSLAFVWVSPLSPNVVRHPVDNDLATTEDGCHVADEDVVWPFPFPV